MHEKLTRRSLLTAGAAIAFPAAVNGTPSPARLVLPDIARDEAARGTDFNFAYWPGVCPRASNVDVFLDGDLVKNWSMADAVGGVVERFWNLDAIEYHEANKDLLRRRGVHAHVHTVIREYGQVQILFGDDEGRRRHLEEFGNQGIVSPIKHPRTDLWYANWWSRRMVDVTMNGDPVEGWVEANAITGIITRDSAFFSAEYSCKTHCGRVIEEEQGVVSIRFRNDQCRMAYTLAFGDKGLARG